jgi:hypothetical protein
MLGYAGMAISSTSGFRSTAQAAYLDAEWSIFLFNIQVS